MRPGRPAGAPPRIPHPCSNRRPESVTMRDWATTSARMPNMSMYRIYNALPIALGLAVTGYYVARTAGVVPDYGGTTAGVTDNNQRSRDAAPVLSPSAAECSALASGGSGDSAADNGQSAELPALGTPGARQTRAWQGVVRDRVRRGALESPRSDLGCGLTLARRLPVG